MGWNFLQTCTLCSSMSSFVPNRAFLQKTRVLLEIHQNSKTYIGYCLVLFAPIYNFSRTIFAEKGFSRTSEPEITHTKKHKKSRTLYRKSHRAHVGVQINVVHPWANINNLQALLWICVAIGPKHLGSVLPLLPRALGYQTHRTVWHENQKSSTFLRKRPWKHHGRLNKGLWVGRNTIPFDPKEQHYVLSALNLLTAICSDQVSLVPSRPKSKSPVPFGQSSQEAQV